MLLAAVDVFIQGGGDGVFLGAVAAQFLGFGNQAVVDGEMGKHGVGLESVLHIVVFEFKCLSRRETPPSKARGRGARARKASKEEFRGQEKEARRWRASQDE